MSPTMTDNQAYGPMTTYNQAYVPTTTYSDSEAHGPTATYSEPYDPEYVVMYGIDSVPPRPSPVPAVECKDQTSSADHPATDYEI